MGNTASKCSREDDGDKTGGPELFSTAAAGRQPAGRSHLASLSEMMTHPLLGSKYYYGWCGRHGLDKYPSPHHAEDINPWKAMFRCAMELFEQGEEEEEANTMKEEVMIFQRVLMDVAVKGRMSKEDEWLLMEWANHRGWETTKEMEIFLRFLRRSARGGWRKTKEWAMFHCVLRDSATGGWDITEILHEEMKALGLRRLAAELERFLWDAAFTPPHTSCCDSSSDPTNEFSESFHHSLTVSW